MDNGGSGGGASGWTSWLPARLNPWQAEVKAREDRNTQRDTNTIVANTSQKLADLKKKRTFLQKRANKLKQAAMAHGTSHEEQIRLATKYKQVHAQIVQLNGLLKNVGGIHSAIDKTATNVQAFEVLQDAQRGFENMTKQVDHNDIDRTLVKLQRNVDHSKHLDRAISRELDWGLDDETYATGGGVPSKSDEAANDLLSAWASEAHMEDMPSAPNTSVLSPQQQSNVAEQNVHNHLKNVTHDESEKNI